MVHLIGIQELQQLIERIGLETFFLDSIAAVKAEYTRWAEFQKSPRHVTHSPQGVNELMPIADSEYYTVKYVNGHPSNPKKNKMTVVALGLLATIEDGYPLMISEMTILTAVRTAATSALVSDYLARKNSECLAIIGTGAQAEFQVLAHHVLFQLKTVRYFDIDPKAMEKFAHNLSNQSFQLIACHNIEDCIEGADIITTATADKKTAHILKNADLKPGVHINGIGGDCENKTELDPLILSQAKIVVEYLPQTRQEGEIQHLKNRDIYAELWELVTEKKPGRCNDAEITLFDSVGFALEDFAILKYLYKKTVELGLGQSIDLIPSPQDPKNLFSCLVKETATCRH